MLTRIWDTGQGMRNVKFSSTLLIWILQILAFTADNASNNNTLVDELEDLLDGFQGSLTRVRCFAHILNLVVKVFNSCIII
jgi:hypothetical protein